MSERPESGAGPDAAAGMDVEGWAPVLPYFDLEVQRRIAWRDGDIVISVPVKSGTTWMMNIVHQLRAGGDPDFEDVYLEVPWLELVTSRSATRDDLVRRFDSMSADRRRAFKTHASVGTLPYHASGSGVDVRYVVVLRNPDEVVASLYPFIHSATSEWYEYWGVDERPFRFRDFTSYYEGFAKTLLPDGVFGFLAAWWPLRHEPNVLLVHFADLKRDHAGSVRRIADFLGLAPTPEQLQAVLEYTSFQWMKAHEDKFEGRLASAVPILARGGMVRKGGVGTAREDGVTPEMSAEMRGLAERVLADAGAVDWLYEGGATD